MTTLFQLTTPLNSSIVLLNLSNQLILSTRTDLYVGVLVGLGNPDTLVFQVDLGAHVGLLLVTVWCG